MSDQGFHVTEIARLEDEVASLREQLNRPVYVTVAAPPTGAAAPYVYKPPDPTMVSISTAITSLGMHLSTQNVMLRELIDHLKS